MKRNDDDLWVGGPWEHATGTAPAPGVYIPPVPKSVLRAKKKRIKWQIPLAIILIILIILTITLGVRAFLLGMRYFSPNPYRGDESYTEQDQKINTEPPSISRAQIGTGVTVDLKPAGGKELTYTQIYEKTLPSMVSIRATDRSTTATGTGIILTGDGYVVTNAHVVAGADAVSITTSTNESYDAKLVGFDPQEDIAVLKVEAEGLTPAEFGDSFELKAGETVAALGDPLGYRATITDGIVSALDREVEVDGVTMTLIQTSAAINFGNSGGALINRFGQVVGITTIKIVSDDGSAEGLGFAIPSQRMKYVVDALIDGRKVVTGAFGFTVQTIPEEGGGLKLLEVDPSSDAYEKGLKAGDILMAVNGNPILVKEDLLRVKQCRGPGDTVTLTVKRDDETFDVEVALVDAGSVNR